MTYPGKPYRSKGRAGLPSRSGSQERGRPRPAQGDRRTPSATPAFAGPIPRPPVLAPAVGAGGGGLGGAIARGAVGGAMRGRAYWPWIVGGAVLGGVGWYVSQWNYAPNLMWMPPRV